MWTDFRNLHLCTFGVIYWDIRLGFAYGFIFVNSSSLFLKSKAHFIRFIILNLDWGGGLDLSCFRFSGGWELRIVNFFGICPGLFRFLKFEDGVLFRIFPSKLQSFSHRILSDRAISLYEFFTLTQVCLLRMIYQPHSEKDANFQKTMSWLYFCENSRLKWLTGL